MMVTFESSSGTKFIVTGDAAARESVVSTHYVPTVSDLEEFVEYVRELRTLRGPADVTYVVVDEEGGAGGGPSTP